ncbi:hypothetical protein BS47DRAFT_1459060 [Hydnum rufescens UP504]|uniref:Major facilitator superfamily (MFS) profile domain-containing protein n=1 Tax=Hydnum rufescens UP504 TaxID=1448309 RepID=A0A9P6DW04_9AGAM|nr:hypothetical protein BS47DRAFT_1459060 [Hydnum rufescens UP504]
MTARDVPDTNLEYASRHDTTDETHQRLARSPTPLPTRQIAILWFLQLCEPIANTVIYPFVNELVKSLEVTNGDDRRVGYYVGIIESTFFFTECLCVLQWGRLSDVIGRRPVICVGLLGVTLSITCFGLSRTFATLVLSRSLAGLTNGNIGVIKSTIGEMSDSTNIVQAFQYMPLCWPIGETIGPLIGGYLSNPAQRFPTVFGDSPLWNAFPYLLPCLVAAIFPLSGFILSLLFLRETVPNPWRWRSWNPIRRSKHDPESRPLLSRPHPVYQNPSLRSVLSKRVIITIANYCLFALVNIAFSVLQPLFLSTPIQHGGLGLHPTRIGYILAAQGVLAGSAVLFASARLEQKLRVKTVFTISMASFAILLGAFPVMNAFARVDDRIGWQVWVVLAVQLLFFGLVNIGYGCIFILVTKASPSRSCLGAVNGCAQTAASLMRAIGPASTTALFAVSVEKNLMGRQARFCHSLGTCGAWRGTEFVPGRWADGRGMLSGGSVSRELGTLATKGVIDYNCWSWFRFLLFVFLVFLVFVFCLLLLLLCW